MTLRARVNAAIVAAQTAKGWQEGSGDFGEPAAQPFHAQVRAELRELVTAVECIERDLEIIEEAAQVPATDAAPSPADEGAPAMREALRQHATCIEDDLTELFAAYLEIEGEVERTSKPSVERASALVRARVQSIYETIAHMRRGSLIDEAVEARAQGGVA